MPKFKKKPIVIEAEQFFHYCPWPEGVVFDTLRGCFAINTLEGRALNVEDGDWIITGVKGEKYPCKDDIFKMTYEPVSDNPVEIVHTNVTKELNIEEIIRGVEERKKAWEWMEKE